MAAIAMAIGTDPFAIAPTRPSLDPLGRIQKLLARIRTSVHPLHKLRSHPAGRYVLEKLDFPVWARLQGVDHSVRISAFRNASYLGGGAEIEQEVRAVFEEVAKTYPISAFWDVGANIGYYSFLMLSRLAGIEVVAYEPDPINLAHLHATCRKHCLTQFRILGLAVSNSQGQDTFFSDPISGVTGSLVDSDGVTGKRLHGVGLDRSINVDTTTLDIESGSNAPDFIKIDVEGAELLVLEGGKKLLSAKPPILIIEVKQANLEKTLRMLSQSYHQFYYIGEDCVSHPNILALPSKYSDLNAEFLKNCRARSIELSEIS